MTVLTSLSETPGRATEVPDRGDPVLAERCLHELFAAQAERTPDAVAIVDGDRSVSYAELRRRAGRLARRLRRLGVGPESRVVVHVERSLEMVVGMLAALEAGGAFVLLDPTLPAARRRLLVDRVRPVALLANR